MNDPTSPSRTPARYRNDMLAEFDRPAGAPVDGRRALRLFGAVVLIGLGIGLSVWVATLIHATVARPEAPALIQRVATTNPADLAIEVPGGKVQLPLGIMALVGYLVVVMLVAIGARVALAFLREGVGLLKAEPERPDQKGS